MPTSGDVVSGDLVSNYPTPSPKKKAMRPPPHEIDSMPPNRIRASNVHPNLTAGKKEKKKKKKKGRRFAKSSEDFLS